MSKIKSTLLVILMASVHFGLMFTLILNRISCEMQANCVSMANKIGSAILGFPLNVVMWMLYPHGTRANGWLYILVLLNSFAAAMIIWFVLVRPFLKKTNKNFAKTQ
jgi:hypothetical protein